ncbi:MAG: methyltransferase domain-containing protein [Alphaproteobacteria bacterium]
MIKDRMDQPIRRLLVTGCGTGVEAVILAQQLNAQVIGIDQPEFGTTLNLDPRFTGMNNVTLQIGDAENLSFKDASFDFVYSFHAIEHFAHYKAALSELKRVLRPGGGCFIGTPNKHRLFAYFGAKADKLTLGQKVSRNLIDYKHRLQGRFENELGAHAGFYARGVGRGADHASGPRRRRHQRVLLTTVQQARPAGSYGDRHWRLPLPVSLHFIYWKKNRNLRQP